MKRIVRFGGGAWATHCATALAVSPATVTCASGPCRPRPKRVKTAPRLSMDGPKKLYKCLLFVCMVRPAPRPRRVKTAPRGGAETPRAAHDARQDITDWLQDITNWRKRRCLGGAPRRRQSVSPRLQVSIHSPRLPVFNRFSCPYPCIVLRAGAPRHRHCAVRRTMRAPRSARAPPPPPPDRRAPASFRDSNGSRGPRVPSRDALPRRFGTRHKPAPAPGAPASGLRPGARDLAHQTRRSMKKYGREKQLKTCSVRILSWSRATSRTRPAQEHERIRTREAIENTAGLVSDSDSAVLA